MIDLRAAALCVTLALVSVPPVTAVAGTLTLSDKAMLQTAMQQYIDRSLVDRRILDVNLANGEVRKLSPVAGHPMILRMGAYFVLCSDFRDEKGSMVNVDFYVARSATGYVVFRGEIDNRHSLNQLMKAGKVVAV